MRRLLQRSLLHIQSLQTRLGFGDRVLALGCGAAKSKSNLEQGRVKTKNEFLFY
jgi:hypothetical protein